MRNAAAVSRASGGEQVRTRAPRELTAGKLRRLGEGIGKVVYASEHWVVKRERQPSEIVALIVLWKALRRLDRHLPFGWGDKLMQRPSLQIRVLRVLVQSCLWLLPMSLWWKAHVRQVFRTYTSREGRGERLAREYLEGTSLVPLRILFPPTRVRVGGWPGWLTVEEAVERVEMTLQDKLSDLARARAFDEMEVWLNRLLDIRQEGWKRGVFSLDAHFKNFGVTGDRIVLLDAGGLTANWAEVEERLRFEDRVTSPHVQLGLEWTLRDRPDIAERFDERWRSVVNPDTVRSLWPAVQAAAS